MVLRAKIKACSSLRVEDSRGRRKEGGEEGRVKMRMGMGLMCLKETIFGKRDGKREIVLRANGTIILFFAD